MENVNLNIRLPKDLVEWLKDQAKHEKRSLSNLIHVVLGRYKDARDA